MAAARQKEKVNYKALGYTVAIHTVLLLSFILLHSSTPIPPPVTPVEGGMEVNLGTSDEGSGHDQPMNTKAPAQYHASVVFNKPAPAAKSPLPKEIVRSNETDAPDVNNKTTSKKATPSTVPAPKPKPHAEEKPR